MPIAAVFEVKNCTASQYDQIIRDLQTSGHGSPKGRRYHVAAPRGRDWFVVDVWDSPEQLQAFAQVLMPIIKRAGVDPLPQPVVLPVHNVITG